MFGCIFRSWFWSCASFGVPVILAISCTFMVDIPFIWTARIAHEFHFFHGLSICNHSKSARRWWIWIISRFLSTGIDLILVIITFSKYFFLLVFGWKENMVTKGLRYYLYAKNKIISIYNAISMHFDSYITNPWTDFTWQNMP